MASGLVQKTVGDGNSGTFAATFLSSDGTGSGHLTPTPTLYDSSGNEISFTTGTAGSPAGGVSSVQGVASMTALATYPFPGTPVSGLTTSMTATTSTAVTGIGAPGGSLHNYITQITVGNATAATSTYVEIQDGSGGTTFYTIPAASAYGGAVLTFPTPLKQPTAATALFCKCTTAPGTGGVIVSVCGFQA